MRNIHSVMFKLVTGGVYANNELRLFDALQICFHKYMTVVQLASNYVASLEVSQNWDINNCGFDYLHNVFI